MLRRCSSIDCLERDPFGLQLGRARNPDCYPGRRKVEARGPSNQGLCSDTPAVLGPFSKAEATVSGLARNTVQSDQFMPW